MNMQKINTMKKQWTNNKNNEKHRKTTKMENKRKQKAMKKQ